MLRMNRMESPRLVGWGYEGKTIDDLIEAATLLQAHAVVDIRLNAISRKKGFSKSQLHEALEASGLRYVHLRSLGNPKNNRAGFAQPDTAEGKRAHSRYEREVLDTPAGEHALHELSDLARDGIVIVLCFESNNSQCHRHLVIEAATKLMH